ncbi:hypothetical protein GCM10025786_14810 [Nocardioides caeni]
MDVAGDGSPEARTVAGEARKSFLALAQRDLGLTTDGRREERARASIASAEPRVIESTPDATEEANIDQTGDGQK